MYLVLAMENNVQPKAFSMEDKIDNLKAQIDELNRIIDEPVSNEYEPEQVSDKYSRLGQLILKMQDGDLQKRYVLRLEKWLMADADALNYYVEFTQICASLQIVLGRKMEKLMPAGVS